MPKDKTRPDLQSRTKEHKELPPKGTAARALMAAGLWSHMNREEIDRIKAEIYESRKSSE